MLRKTALAFTLSLSYSVLVGSPVIDLSDVRK